MNSLLIGLITFVCALGGALLGLSLRGVLPEHHLSQESKDAIKMGAGFIATLTALVLGFLISSAKDSFDTMNGALTRGGARVILLDRTLAHYGQETAPIRSELRGIVESGVKAIWSKEARRQAAFERVARMERIQSLIVGMVPLTDAQRWLQSRALEFCGELLEERWQALEQKQLSLPTPFWAVLLLWLVALFASIGLLAARNNTVYAVLFVCALSISGAVFLVHEMNEPMAGLIHVSQKPLLKALDHLGN